MSTTWLSLGLISYDKSLNNATLIVVNAMGEVVYSANKLYGQQYMLPRNNLAADTYSFQLLQEGKSVASGKIVWVD